MAEKRNSLDFTVKKKTRNISVHLSVNISKSGLSCSEFNIFSVPCVFYSLPWQIKLLVKELTV